MYVENLTTVLQLADTAPDEPNLEIIASLMNNKLNLTSEPQRKLLVKDIYLYHEFG